MKCVVLLEIFTRCWYFDSPLAARSSKFSTIRKTYNETTQSCLITDILENKYILPFLHVQYRWPKPYVRELVSRVELKGCLTNAPFSLSLNSAPVSMKTTLVYTACLRLALNNRNVTRYILLVCSFKSAVCSLQISDAGVEVNQQNKNV